MELGDVPNQLLKLCFLFIFPFLGPDFLKFLWGLVGGPLPLGPLETLKESLFISNNAFLIIDLFLVLNKSFPPDPALLILNLFGDEVAHEEWGPILHQLFDLDKHILEVAELLVEGADGLMLYLSADGCEVQRGCMQDVLDISCQLRPFPLQFYYCVHLQKLELYKNFIHFLQILCTLDPNRH